MQVIAQNARCNGAYFSLGLVIALKLPLKSYLPNTCGSFLPDMRLLKYLPIIEKEWTKRGERTFQEHMAPA
jgi:hypothetical protein